MSDWSDCNPLVINNKNKNALFTQIDIRYVIRRDYYNPEQDCLLLCCSLYRVVVLESRPTDNPTALSNLYILAGHENSYWASTHIGQFLGEEVLVPRLWEGTPDFDLKLCVTGRRLVSKRVFFVTDDGIDWSEIQTEERLISSLITSSTLVWNGAVRATDGGTHRISRCFLLSHSSVLWTELQTSYSRYYRQKCH